MALFCGPVLGRQNMIRKLMTLMLISSSIAVAACNTVRGAGADLQSAANCTENAIKDGYC